MNEYVKHWRLYFQLSRGTYSEVSYCEVKEPSTVTTPAPPTISDITNEQTTQPTLDESTTQDLGLARTTPLPETGESSTADTMQSTENGATSPPALSTPDSSTEATPSIDLSTVLTTVMNTDSQTMDGSSDSVGIGADTSTIPATAESGSPDMSTSTSNDLDTSTPSFSTNDDLGSSTLPTGSSASMDTGTSTDGMTTDMGAATASSPDTDNPTSEISTGTSSDLGMDTSTAAMTSDPGSTNIPVETTADSASTDSGATQPESSTSPTNTDSGSSTEGSSEETTIDLGTSAPSTDVTPESTGGTDYSTDTPSQSTDTFTSTNNIALSSTSEMLMTE
ncbi:hypothetical protein ANCDUO_06670 [Ancylostoma duodenale]|uniref:Uncharacterized protein n=1 Tax=Ancylostoma duodenale TaxID=51022 RepID=A0A0C2D133_9BILA|nr:hypothetical protein ANCDUO_06670 [Ancylostoma duodenale]